MKPVLYEIRKVLTSKAMIVLFVLLIALPILIAVSSASNTGSSTLAIDSTGYGYGGNGTYHVSVFLYNNQYGNPVQGTQVKIFTGTSIINGKTGANGFLNETFHNLTSNEAGNLTFQYNVTEFGSTSTTVKEIAINSDRNDQYFTSFSQREIVNNTIENTTTYYPRMNVYTLSVRGHPDLATLGIYFASSGLKTVPPVYVYYKPLFNVTQTNTPGGGVVLNERELVYSNISAGNRTLTTALINPEYLSNESQLQFFGKYQGFPMMPMNTLKLASGSNDTYYLFEFFSPNGTELAYFLLQPHNNYSGSRVSSIFNQDELPLLGVFVPLMAVFTGFNSFGRDKVDGALNYVVVRPITRRSLVASRFLSSVLAIFTASAISVGISSVVFHYYLGTFIPTGTIYLSLWTIAVMAAGFTGLVFLASSMMRSPSRLIGATVGIFLVLDLFWSFPGFPIIPSVVSSTATIGSLKYALIYVAMEYMTPSGFVNLVSYIIYGNTSQPVYLGNYVPSQIGITTLAVIAVGLAWVIIPVVLSLIRFSKFD